MGRAGRDAGSEGELVDAFTSRRQILTESHGTYMPQKRGIVNPATGAVVIRAKFWHHSPMGECAASYADVLFQALFGLIERDGQAPTLRRAGIAQGTFDHWQKARADGRKPGLNRSNFEALCSLPEVRAALASALLNRPDHDATAWEAIAGELSRILATTTGWELVRKLQAMEELEILDGGLSSLDGMITGRRRALAERVKAESRAARAESKKK